MPNFTICFKKGQRKALLKLYKYSSSKISIRAHFVILFEKGFSVAEIAKICFSEDGTVYCILKRFIQQGVDGLYDKVRTGRPSILTPEDKRVLFHALLETPRKYGYHASNWTIPLMTNFLEKSCNKKMSNSGLKQLLYREGWSWNRPKLIPPPPEGIEEKNKVELLRLLENKREDEVILFGDECDFELLPYLSGRWMPKGIQLEIPTPGQNKVLCIFGFFNPEDSSFIYKSVQGRKQKNTKNFIAFLHQVRKNYKGNKIHLVVDNASIHNEKNKKLKRFMKKYEGEVFIHFLPKRATLLNPIERFWQFLKKRFSCNWLYNSIEELDSSFRKFIWHYRENSFSYNFNKRKFVSTLKKWPTLQAS